MRWPRTARDGVAGGHEPPRWSGPDDGTRILVEHPDPTVRAIVQRDLAAEGWAVLTCAGPGEAGSGGGCPLLRQEVCPAVAGADAVVSGLPLHDPRARLIVHRIERDDPARPLIVEASGQVAEQHDLDAAVQHLYPLRRQSLVRMLAPLVPPSGTGTT